MKLIQKLIVLTAPFLLVINKYCCGQTRYDTRISEAEKVLVPTSGHTLINGPALVQVSVESPKIDLGNDIELYTRFGVSSLSNMFLIRSAKEMPAFVETFLSESNF